VTTDTLWYKRTAVNPLIASAQADVVGWICLVVGIVVLFGGVGIGLWTSLTKASQKAEDAMSKLDEAKARIGEAKAHIQRTTEAVAEPGLEAAGAVANATSEAQAAGESTEAAQSALEEVQGIVASLPENLRFSGLLVLVGTVLIGVATIQFGGVSLF